MTGWINFSQSGQRWGKGKLNRRRKMINLINQLLSIIAEAEDRFGREVLKSRPVTLAGCSFPKESLFLPSSSRLQVHLKSLIVVSSPWDSVRGRFCLTSAAFSMQKQPLITSQWVGEQKSDKESNCTGV